MESELYKSIVANGGSMKNDDITDRKQLTELFKDGFLSFKDGNLSIRDPPKSYHDLKTQEEIQEWMNEIKELGNHTSKKWVLTFGDHPVANEIVEGTAHEKFQKIVDDWKRQSLIISVKMISSAGHRVIRVLTSLRSDIKVYGQGDDKPFCEYMKQNFPNSSTCVQRGWD
jgi:hypothetical protein